MAIRKSKELNALLGKPEDVKLENGGSALRSAVYHLFPADLRLSPAETMHVLTTTVESQSSPILSTDLPTLLLFECVLVYMSPAASTELIQWFVDYLSSSQTATVIGAIVYEMFGLNDSFGKVMLSNLKARNVTLPGAEPYPDVASLPSRFLKHEFSASRAKTLRDIRRSFISPAELERISQLEMLDEVEELDLVLEHYAITWGFRLYRTGHTAHWAEWDFVPPA